MRPLLAALVLWLAGTACAFAQNQPEAGTIEFLEGDALIEATGVPNRIAKQGDPVYQGDTITTFAGTELQLRMADGGYLSLRENTKITLTTYRANGDDKDESLIDLAKGAFRSVTGWIAKQRSSAYTIRTPMVTIGVRGTDHEVVHFEAGDPRGEPGSYDKVNEGRTVMQTKQGRVEVGPNQSARFHPDLRGPPRVLPSVPNFFKPAKNEQRFVERSRVSARTLEAQRSALREKRGLNKTKAPEKKQFEKRPVQKKAVEKRQVEKKHFEKKQFDKKTVEKKHFEKKR
jgi:hypothetical protein